MLHVVPLAGTRTATLARAAHLISFLTCFMLRSRRAPASAKNAASQCKASQCKAPLHLPAACTTAPPIKTAQATARYLEVDAHATAPHRPIQTTNYTNYQLQDWNGSPPYRTEALHPTKLEQCKDSSIPKGPTKQTPQPKRTRNMEATPYLEAAASAAATALRAAAARAR
jgi:hypothetical protein